MSTKIKDATLIQSVTGTVMIPVGNTEDDTQPLALTVGQIKTFVDSDRAAVATSGSYNDLTDTPDLSQYALLSNLNNNFYNRTQINSMVGTKLSMEFVDELPPDGEVNKIYFVKSEDPQTKNLYDEYVWNEDEHDYEIVSKTGYITKREVEEMIPPVYNSQITIKQGGATKGTFTLNQSGNATINIDAVANVQSDWNQSDSSQPDYIKNKPTIPTVNNPTIYFTQGGVSKGSITLNQSGSATIAFDAGGGGGGSLTQVQTNWAETDATSVAFIQNKPVLATVATSGSYNDLTNKPTMPVQLQSDWNQTDTAAKDYIKNKPTVPAAQVNSDWNSNSGVAQILNKPSFSTVALTGNYNDLSNRPVIPAPQVNSDWNASTGIAQILNKPVLGTMASEDASDYTPSSSLSRVATTGSYTDLSDLPTIPAAQVNSDWNSNSGVSQILNKPSLAAVATTGSYTDLSNKPSIPSNTRALLITYDDQSQETITVFVV